MTTHSIAVLESERGLEKVQERDGEESPILAVPLSSSQAGCDSLTVLLPSTHVDRDAKAKVAKSGRERERDFIK